MVANIGYLLRNTSRAFYQVQAIREKVQIVQFPTPQTQLVTSHQMERLIRKGALAYIIQCQEMELLTCEGDEYKLPEIQEFIQKHHKVL